MLNSNFQTSNVNDRNSIDELSFYNEEYNETKDNGENETIDPIEIDENTNCDQASNTGCSLSEGLIFSIKLSQNMTPPFFRIYLNRTCFFF